MNEQFKKLSEEIRAKISEQLQSKEMQDFIAATKAAEDTGSFEVVISTADIDRDGESIDQSGWDLSFYQMNPIVLWAHDYNSLPIGIADVALENGKLVGRGKFAPESANPFAQQVRRLYDLKIVRATSVGFIVLEMNGNIVTKAQLLEFSFVPVPANPYALTLSKARELGLNLQMLAMKGLKIDTTEEMKGAIPYADHGAAPEDAEWDASKEVQAVGEDYPKLKEMCAWYDAEKPDVQASYKLPHHQADGLKAVWKGVAAAMGALLGARGGVDIPDSDKDAVYSHLAKHYAEFKKEPPEKTSKQNELPPDAEEGDDCTMPDGSSGQVIDDGGQLICAPKIEEKPKSPTCRQDGDTKEECAARKIPEILKDNPEMPQDQAIAIAESMCSKACSEKGAGAAHESNPMNCASCQEAIKTAIAAHQRETKTAVIAHTQKITEIVARHYGELVKQAINPNEAPSQKGGEGEEQSDGTAPKQRSVRARYSDKEALNEFLSQRQVLRLVNNVTSEALRKLNERVHSKIYGSKRS